MSRRTMVRRVGGVVLLANVTLALAKAAVWWRTGSLAVGSETVNSVADSVYSAIVLAGLILTTRPPDFDHPHGHERIEPFVSLFVAFGIATAAALVLWQAVDAALFGTPLTSIGLTAVAVLVGSGVVKFGLYRYCVGRAQTVGSPAIRAMGLDNRNDMLTVGAALIGVLGVRAGVPILDPLAAGAVSLGIFYTAWVIARDNVQYLIGRAPPEEFRERILRRALDHPDVNGAHDVVAHHVGPEIDVSLHIEVEGDLTLLEAHRIESEVAAAIRELERVDDVFVHVDPRELGEWKDDTDVDRLLGS